MLKLLGNIFCYENAFQWAITASLGLLFFLIILHQKKYSHRNKLLAKLPGPKTRFLFGNLLELCGKRQDVLSNAIKLTKYGDYPLARVWFGPFPYVGIYDAKLAEAILSSQTLINKGRNYDFLIPWLGLGLLISSGKKWKTRRKMITPTFHFNILEEFRPIINEHAEKLVTILQQYDGKGEFDVYPYCTRCTLDIICETAMGKTINAQSDVESEYMKAVYTLTELAFKRGIYPWLRSNFIFNLTADGRNHARCLNIVHDFTDKIIIDRRKALQKKKIESQNSVDIEDTEILGKRQRLAFLDMLLESTIKGHSLSDADIREEVDTFMFEGHDTTAVALVWAIYNIGRLPEIQKKVHEELDHIFGDSDRPVTSDDLADLRFLECVIKESLRMFPSVHFILRRFEEDVKIGDYIFPADVDIAICIYLMHHDPKYFPNPETFDPDRFLAENSANRHPYAYIPFSAGPRNCVGQKFAMMEEKILLAHILRRFKVTTMEEVKDHKMLAEVVLRPFDGMWIKIESRK